VVARIKASPSGTALTTIQSFIASFLLFPNASAEAGCSCVPPQLVGVADKIKALLPRKLGNYEVAEFRQLTDSG